MNFAEAISRKKHYSSFSEMISNNQRKSIWEEYKNSLFQLTTELKDLYDINEVYLINDSIIKNIYKIDNLSILYEFNKQDFDDFVDSMIIEDFDFDFYCNVDDKIYHYNGSSWIKENLKINKMPVSKYLNE